MSFFDNKIFLDLRNARSRLNYIPLKKGSAVEYRPGSPIMALVSADKGLQVFFGNTNVTQLDPEYREFDSSIDHVTMDIDGSRRDVPFGTMLSVNQTFRVEPLQDYRVNVIGFSRPGVVNEAGFALTQRDMQPSYSVDKAGSIYRVEVYRGEKFCGMILVAFRTEPPARMAKTGTDNLLRQLKKNGELTLGR